MPRTSDQSTADRLLETAAALFRRKGYASSSTRELADLLGIQKATLYYHVKGKEELLLAICRASLHRIYDDVSIVASTAPAEKRLRAMIEAHMVSALQDQDMHAVMLMELRALSPAHKKEIVLECDHYQELIRQAVAEDQVAGRVRDDIDARYLTLALLNSLNWSIFWFDPHGEMTPAELGAMLADVYLDGVTGSRRRRA